MCGIAGYQGKKEQGLIAKMVNSIGHRGPDNQGILELEKEQIALGHSRLSIIDHSIKSNQPLWDSSRRHCIVFNGEIYNYKELRDSLEERGHKFESSGDAEVLLNLYIEHGVGSLDKINGIFSLAVWSEEKKELFIARDHMGVKPLYYSEPDSGFVFSSELKSLLQDISVSRELDLNSVFHYLRYLWCPAPMSPLKQVKKLEPGGYLVVRAGKVVTTQRYFDPVFNTTDWLTEKASSDNLLSALENSVHRQLVADVKVGAFLSGGLDSSAVVALAAKHLGSENLPCFTIDVDGGDTEGMENDLPYAKKVAEHLGVPLHIVKVESSIASELPQLVYQLDEPQADLAPLNAWYIAKAAQKLGIKVLLSGAGGDDLLTGYRRHYALVNEKYWAWLPRFIRLGLKKLSKLLPNRNPFFRRIAKAFENAGLTQGERLLGYFHWIDDNELELLFKQPDVNVQDPLEDYISALPPGMTPLQRMLQIEMRFFLPDHNFNYTDKVSMAEGVEVRVPLVDLEMVSVAAKIPDKFKQKGAQGKWIFKRVMERFLPKEIIYRKKTGFGAPIRPWIRNDLKGMVDDVLSVESIEERGVFNSERVRELVAKDRAGKVDAAYTILSLMCFELWCRQFIDPETPTPLPM